MEDTKEKKDVVPSQYREKYAETGGTCGDFIATDLKKVTEDGPQALDTIFTENGLSDLTEKYKTFNVGMRRMNLSNVLRARFLKGETIKILGKEYNLRHVADDIGGVENNDKSVGKLIKAAGVQDDARTRKAIVKTFFEPPKKTAEEREKERADAKAAKEAEKAAKAKERADAKAKRDAEKEEAKRAKEAEKAAKAKESKKD